MFRCSYYAKVCVLIASIVYLSNYLCSRVEKDLEPKVPKKRGPKPKVKLNEDGEPIDPATEKKPKR